MLVPVLNVTSLFVAHVHLALVCAVCGDSVLWAESGVLVVIGAEV